MNESTLAAKRWATYAGIRVFSEGRKGGLQNAVFFPGLKLGAIKISEKTSKNCIIWEIKGIFERPFLLRYLRIYLQSLFFFFVRQNWATVQDAISGVGSHGSWQDAFQASMGITVSFDFL